MVSRFFVQGTLLSKNGCVKPQESFKASSAQVNLQSVPVKVIETKTGDWLINQSPVF
jgi:hypothetical protein